MRKITSPRKVKTLVLFFYFLIPQADVSAQDSVNRISVLFGPGFMARQDLVFSPFIHKDVSVSQFGLRYERTKKFHQVSRLNYSGFSSALIKPYTFYVNGRNQASTGNQYTFFNLYHSFSARVAKTSNTSSWLGAYLGFDVHSMNYNYGRISSFGYYANISYGIAFKEVVELSKKHRLSAGVDLALFSWQSRSPYLVNDDEFIENISSHNSLKTFGAFLADGYPVLISRFQSLNLNAEYTWHASARWNIGAAWRFAFISSPFPRKLIHFQHNLDFLLAFKF